MSVMLGSKERFAAEVGEFRGGSRELRRVDVWAAGRWLTCDDNVVALPHFAGGVRDTLDWLRAGGDLSLPFPGLPPVESHRRLLAADDGSRERFWFPLWGETTDNVTGHLFRLADRLVFTFEFWRATHHTPSELGQVFAAELPEAEFVGVLDGMLAALGGPDVRPTGSRGECDAG